MKIVTWHKPQLKCFTFVIDCFNFDENFEKLYSIIFLPNPSPKNSENTNSNP